AILVVLASGIGKHQARAMSMHFRSPFPSLPIADNFPTALTIEGAALRAHREEAEILLRTGAILNAVQSSSRHVMRAVTTAEERCDQLHAWIEVGSHLTKCHVVFQKRFGGLAWHLVARGEPKSEPFTADMPVAKLRALFERDSWFMN